MDLRIWRQSARILDYLTISPSQNLRRHVPRAYSCSKRCRQLVHQALYVVPILLVSIEILLLKVLVPELLRRPAPRCPEPGLHPVVEFVNQDVHEVSVRLLRPHFDQPRFCGEGGVVGRRAEVLLPIPADLVVRVQVLKIGLSLQDRILEQVFSSVALPSTEKEGAPVWPAIQLVTRYFEPRIGDLRNRPIRNRFAAPPVFFPDLGSRCPVIQVLERLPCPRTRLRRFVRVVKIAEVPPLSTLSARWTAQFFR